MKLFEYEAKNILAKYGVPVPQGGLASDPSQSREVAARLKMPVAVKAQVLVAGRGKAGGIVFASSLEEVERTAGKLLNMQIKGIPVKNVWIEEKIQVKRELYFGLTTDRFRQQYVTIASRLGGIDIEEIASRPPRK